MYNKYGKEEKYYYKRISKIFIRWIKYYTIPKMKRNYVIMRIIKWNEQKKMNFLTIPAVTSDLYNEQRTITKVYEVYEKNNKINVHRNIFGGRHI